MSKLLTIAIPVATALAVLATSALALPAALTALLAGLGVALGALRPQRTTAMDRTPQFDQREQRLLLREEQVAHTAHELRTPLTAITTALELLREGYATTPEDQATFLDQAAVAARHMAFLINDVVDLAALESGHVSLHVRSHRVQEVMFDVAQVMQLTAQNRGVELLIAEPHEDLMVMVDRGRFLQIVFNLVANALKFSAHGSAVRMVTEATADEVVFEVHDSGPGVDAEQRPRLFTRYGRTHEHRMAGVPGTGLGLHVSKLLVERMGGRIGYRPGTEAGSVFWFSLPRCKESSSSSAAAVAEAATAMA